MLKQCYGGLEFFKLNPKLLGIIPKKLGRQLKKISMSPNNIEVHAYCMDSVL